MDEINNVIIALSKSVPGATIGQHLNHINLLVGKKVFGFIRKDGLVLKLPQETIKKILNGSTIIRLVMGKKEMKEWVIIAHQNPEEYKKDLSLLKESAAFVSAKN